MVGSNGASGGTITLKVDNSKHWWWYYNSYTSTQFQMDS